MTLAAIFMCIKEKSLVKYDGGELFSMMFSGRYIILLMGLFSMYTGLVYNDIFSQSMSLFNSGWQWPADRNGTLNAVQTGVYPFGVDPVWHGTDNQLLFTNSYKMKMSVIFGVVQMSFGIILTTYNHFHFKRTYAIWAEFVPQLLFLWSLFGYLTFCIIYKWVTDWTNKPSPPGLLNTLIYMFLRPGQVAAGDQLFSGQAIVQTVLLLLAVICIPWMLLAKPFILKRQHQQGHTEVVVHDGVEEMQQEQEFDFSEIMVHQVIHTIEFCLGAISNTASYLRLWALSLAHAQLSVVLWEMTIGLIFGLKNLGIMVVGLIVAFTLWFVLTIGILIVMEGLSAFLHALRLHWVEFNGKFYEGTGKKFLPFSYTSILTSEEVD